MKIIHLSWNKGKEGGGISYSIDSLNSELNKRNISSTWISTDKYNFPFAANKLIDDLIFLKPSLIHIHGLWRLPTRIYKKLIKNNLKYLIAPHGMLNPYALKQSSLKKKIAWRLWEENALKNSNCIHALSDGEASTIKNILPNNKVEILPNSIETISNNDQNLFDVPWKNDIPSSDNVLLFLSRYHIGKGINVLLDSWSNISEMALEKNWWLVFVGYGDNGKLQNDILSRDIPRCFAYGPAFGLEKKACLSSASAFILPSQFEALPIAVLESLSYGLPCLISQACNLPESFKDGAAIIADPIPFDLTNALKKLLSLSKDELKLMSLAAKRLIDKNYSNDIVGTKILETYTKIINHY